MYGYVTPVKEELHCSDFMLFRSFYCGICKAMGKFYGQLPRFTTNYDITFLSVLLHEYTGAEYVFEKKGCVLNPFKKKIYVAPNGFGERIAAANIILSYYKAADGCIDREGAKMRVVRGLLKKPYRKASALLPGVDNACKTWYDRLRALEKENCPSPDRAADCFANMLKEVTLRIAECDVRTTKEAQSNLSALAYNVGKFVYLADALDDAGEDFKKKRYNPFLVAYGGFTTRAEFIEKNREPLTFILASSVNRAIESFNNLRHSFKDGGGLLQNIVYRGLRSKCGELLASEKKIKPPRL